MTVTAPQPGLRHMPSHSETHLPTAHPLLDAHPARMRDYVLGGSDHYPADRSTVRNLMDVAPCYETSVQINHEHNLLTAGLLATGLGIGQFLDLGPGLPSRPGYTDTYPRICSVLQDVTVIHVDTHTSLAGPTRTCTANGRHLFLRGDITQPLPLLRNPLVQGFIDLCRPVGVLAPDTLSWIPDDAGVLHLMDRLRDWAPPGSALALTHATHDFTPTAQAEATTACLRAAGLSHHPRTRTEIARLLRHWDLREPGLVATGHYHRNHPHAHLPDRHSAAYAAIALRPPGRSRTAGLPVQSSART
ncbi:hypothetical protein ACVWZD_000444 [Streptomyces sp. TE3672]